MLKIEIARLYGDDIFSFIRNYQAVSRVVVPFHISTSNILVIQFSHMPAVVGIITIFNFSHFDRHDIHRACHAYHDRLSHDTSCHC